MIFFTQCWQCYLYSFKSDVVDFLAEQDMFKIARTFQKVTKNAVSWIS